MLAKVICEGQFLRGIDLNLGLEMAGYTVSASHCDLVGRARPPEVRLGCDLQSVEAQVART